MSTSDSAARSPADTDQSAATRHHWTAEYFAVNGWTAYSA